MSTDIMKNDLEYYETITHDNSPAMTWSFFTVGFKWVNDFSKRDSYFRKSYQNYIISPFKVGHPSLIWAVLMFEAILCYR